MDGWFDEWMEDMDQSWNGWMDDNDVCCMNGWRGGSIGEWMHGWGLMD